MAAAKKKEIKVETKAAEKVNQVLANENIKELIAEHKTKSAVIRYLASRGYTRSNIAKAMDIRYQFVRNVLVKEAQKKED